MLNPIYLSRFEKKLKKVLKRGKDKEKLKTVIKLLLTDTPLPAKYKNHKLKGEYADHWECHIEPDWLLVYQKTATEIILVNTGTHADLF